MQVSSFVEMEHVPQLVLFSATNKTGIAYSGAGVLKNILKFAEQHAT